jgi:predicted AAA+ superfamily ATPase
MQAAREQADFTSPQIELGSRIMTDQEHNALLARIADALERLAPPETRDDDFKDADAFVWHAESGTLKAVHRFAEGLPANNALLWGARGMGKSSLVKSVHAAINQETPEALALIEIHREDIGSLPGLLGRLRGSDRRCLLLCDDLSFETDDATFKSLKAVLEGGIEGRPDNVIFYATSNRRHLMPRDMMENERSTAINPAEVVEEKVSLSDRFGLWLGFHGCDQPTYLAIVQAYVDHFGLEIDADDLRAQAIAWQTGRGARSGRVAWQFIQDLAGRLGQRLLR